MVKFLPGILGALLVVAGVVLVWLPAGLVVAGGFLLLVDNQIKLPAKPRMRRPNGEVTR